MHFCVVAVWGEHGLREKESKLLFSPELSENYSLTFSQLLTCADSCFLLLLLRSDDEGLRPRVDQPLPHLRLRAVHTLERYIQGKRLQALLSPEAVQLLHFACERCAEHMQEKPDAEFDLWAFVDAEARPTRLQRAAGATARALGRCWPPLGRPLRRMLARHRLVCCEAVLEFYLGLSCSKHLEVSTISP